MAHVRARTRVFDATYRRPDGDPDQRTAFRAKRITTDHPGGGKSPKIPRIFAKSRWAAILSWIPPVSPSMVRHCGLRSRFSHIFRAKKYVFSAIRCRGMFAQGLTRGDSQGRRRIKGKKNPKKFICQRPRMVGGSRTGPRETDMSAVSVESSAMDDRT